MRVLLKDELETNQRVRAICALWSECILHHNAAELGRTALSNKDLATQSSGISATALWRL